MLKNKKVLVTGGAGFIGSSLVRRLVEEKADVSVLVRYNSKIDNVRLSPLWEKLDIIEGDIRNTDSLKQLEKKGFDVVFHLAAYNHVGHSFTHVSECFDVNAKGTANLLDAFQGDCRFIYTSTSEIYSLQETVPFNEEMNPRPISPYSISKYAGELYCRMK